ncbi:MAG: Mur ligase domain-containing protein, partial [Clostridiales Family XIII bacterium]|nr:Mur ligase domain-containing protein [Clostridiales Family XIII bacterium]
MRFSKLLEGIPHRIISGGETEITGVNIDSRLVREGDLFVATVGREADGHDYIGQALARGAAAVLACEGATLPHCSDCAVVP